MRRWSLIFVILFFAGPVCSQEKQDGTFENPECITCHEKTDQKLVNDWRASSHAKNDKKADCVSCHGKKHKNVASMARKNKTCIDCHGGAKAPVVHSYRTSKHGVIAKLEQNTWDWSHSLERGNYRTPTCAYCHMHSGNHDTRTSIRKWTAQEDTSLSEKDRMLDHQRAVCQDCHSPRYITRLFENGEAMLSIARMKLREATKLVKDESGNMSDESRLSVNKKLDTMKQHLKNVYIGVGHQSPDYQWWHGQPALDGDLLRIKDEIGTLQRKKNIANDN